MTDKELLEYAAKATGIELGWPAVNGYKVDFGRGVWSPLTDDGDAMSLVIDLQLDISFSGAWVFVSRDENFDEIGLPFGADPKAAVRRAIVRAAAEIGKEIEEHDLNKCPKCGGVADNGHDRCHPPNPYYCSACMAEGVGQPEQKPVAYMMVNRSHGLQPSLHWEPQKDWHSTWECVPLYTAPITTEFVGLDLSEMDEIVKGNITITDSRLRDGAYGVVLETMITLMKKNNINLGAAKGKNHA